MENKDKFIKAREIDHDLQELNSFLKLLEKHNTHHCEIDGKVLDDKKINEINGITIYGKIWTGSDTANYNETVNSKDFITEIKKSLVNITKEYIEKKQLEFDKLFSKD